MCKHGFVKYNSLWNCHPQLLIVRIHWCQVQAFTHNYNETDNLQNSQPAQIFHFNSVILVGLCHGLKSSPLYYPSKAERKKFSGFLLLLWGRGVSRDYQRIHTNSTLVSINWLASRAQKESQSLWEPVHNLPFLHLNRWFPEPKAHISNHTIHNCSQSAYLFNDSTSWV